MALIADVFDVILIDETTGDTIATTTLQDANIDISVQENEVRAGKGNQLIGIIHSQRDIGINLTDAEFKYDWLAKQLGQNIVTGAGVGYAMPKWYTAVDNTGSIEITLDETPLTTNNGLKTFDVDGKEVTGTLSGKVVTFAAGVNEGDAVEVRTYKYDTDAATETISIDNTVFATGVIAVLETLEIDGDENPTHKLQYQFDRAVPSGNVTINTSSERNANTQGFDLKVIKPKTSNVVGKIMRMPIA